MALPFPPPAPGGPRFVCFAMHRGEGTLALTFECEFPGKGIVYDCCPRELNTLLLEIEVL